MIVKRILFVSYQFLPVVNADVAWLVNVFELLKNEEDIDVDVCTITRNGIKKKERISNVNVIRLWRITDYYCCLRERIEGFLAEHELLNSKICKSVDLILEPMNKLVLRHSCYGEKAFSDNICSYIDGNNYDIVVSYVRPGQNASAAYRIKVNNPRIKWINCYFDMYSSVPFFDEKTKGILREQERIWTESADVNIYAKDLVSYIEQTEFWSERSMALPIPAFSIKDIYECDGSKKGEFIEAVYTGQFYEDIRRPEYLLDLFDNICKLNNRVRLHIAGWGMEKVLNSYKQKMGRNLILHGRLNLKDTNELLKKADILVNVGNNVPYFLPSKLLSYLKTRKPILHISSIKDDPSIGYVCRYPIQLCLAEKDLSEGPIKNTLAFILENHSRRCDSKEISEIYYNDSAEYFTEKLLAIFRSLI